MKIANAVFIILMLSISAAFAAPIENVVSSALMPGDSVMFNLDFIDPFGLPFYDIMVKAKPTGSGADSTVILEHLPADPRYLNTYGGTIHFSSPTGQYQFYGRVAADTFVTTQSFYNGSDQFPPPALLYADLAPDAVNDTTPGTLGQWLDLTGTAVTYSSLKLYTRLSHVGGSWPTNQGLTTYFVYGVFLANPDTISLSATALIYANIPFILSSGLYSVNLADTSFSRIADISAQVSSGSLHMSCNIEDIISDPNFPSWPPASGHIIMGGFTMTITLDTPQFNDYTYPSSFIPKTQFFSTSGNEPPFIYNPAFGVIPNIAVNVSCQYSDPEGNMPVVRQLFFDRGVFDMGTIDHDSYADIALFTHTLPWPGEGEHVYFFRFSDGAATFETPMDTVYISASGIEDGPLPESFMLYQNYPNPFNGNTQIEFNLPVAGDIRLAVYDIRGNEIAALADGYFSAGHHNLTWDGINSSGHPVSSGIYFYKLSTKGEQNITKRMLLLK